MVTLHTPTPLSFREACAALGVSRYTLLRYLESGQVDGFRLPGGHWRIRRESVERIRTGSNNEGSR